MREALRLARKGELTASPNPMVGAVVSVKGEIVGTGWHRGPGQPHAEPLAIAGAGERARGATLHVNLEPCVHTGRTPPCVPEIIAAGIRRVYVAMRDPDPRVSGRGFRALKRAGLEVIEGSQDRAAFLLNEPYAIHRKLGRPMLTYKAAITMDGRTAAADGSSKWITSEGARLDAHRLRAVSDAVAVGAGTVVTDDPELSARVPRRKDSVRVVFDSKLKTPRDARIFSSAGTVLVYSTPGASAARQRALARAGAEIVFTGTAGGKVDLEEALVDLGSRGVLSLLLEGGPRLGAAFHAIGLVDRYLFYLAPKLVGDSESGVLRGWSASGIAGAADLVVESMRKIGPDIKIVARCSPG